MYWENERELGLRTNNTVLMYGYIFKELPNEQEITTILGLQVEGALTNIVGLHPDSLNLLMPK